MCTIHCSSRLLGWGSARGCLPGGGGCLRRWGCLPREVSAQEVSAQGGGRRRRCLPSGYLPRGCLPRGCLPRGVSAQRALTGAPCSGEPLPPPSRTEWLIHWHGWKHYLPATSLSVGNNKCHRNTSTEHMKLTIFLSADSQTDNYHTSMSSTAAKQFRPDHLCILIISFDMFVLLYLWTLVRSTCLFWFE